MKQGANRSSSQPELEQKPKVTEAHAKAVNYLAQQRVKKEEAAKQYGSAISLDQELEATTGKKKVVGDSALNKILKDKNISEYERMEAVRLRAEQI